jgi:hypothetical protein
MTLEEKIARNDTLRTQLKGGVVLMTPGVWDIPAWFRGRAIYRMTQAQKYTNDDHSEGVFVFGGYCFYWTIGEFAGELSITLMLGGEA